MKVGPCISACVGSSDQKASNTASAAMVAASAMVPPVSALDSADDVRDDARRLAGEQRPGAAEAGEHLVEDQQQAMPVGERAQLPQHIRRMKDHAAGALHQRLDDDRRELVARVRASSRVERRLARLVASADRR